MANQRAVKKGVAAMRGFRRKPAAVLALCAALALQGCFDPVYPQRDREDRVVEALILRDERAPPPSPLTASGAVEYALCNNIDAKAAEIEMAYHNEAAVAAKRRLLPSLNGRYYLERSNHPNARWSESTRDGSQSLASSYSSDPAHRQGEIGLMWNILDFGVGYLKARQQGEKIRHSAENYRRMRQQVTLDVLTHYWRASAAVAVAGEAEELRAELEGAALAVRDSVDMRILSAAEGARRELAIHAGLTELDQWRRIAGQARLELARALGGVGAPDFALAEFPEDVPDLSGMGDDPSALQTAALQRRPELFQQDSQERVAVDEARLALLQMAPNANLSLGLYDDPDKFLEWNNWMSVGARVSWNLFNIPARLSEKRMANLQEDAAHRKGLALAAAVMAQVGIAYSEWRVSHETAAAAAGRTAARERLVEALAAGEADGQTRPGEVLQERVRLLADRAAVLRALAEARVAGARLANAVGLDVDDQGRLLWRGGDDLPVDLLASGETAAMRSRLRHDDAAAAKIIPAAVPGMRVVMAEDFEAPAEYFFESARTAGIAGGEGGTAPKRQVVAQTPAESARGGRIEPALPIPSALDGPAYEKSASAAFPGVPGEAEAARINRWADEAYADGGITPALVPERGSHGSGPVEAVPGTRPGSTGVNGRLMPAEQMRRLYAREREDSSRSAAAPARRTPVGDIVGIPALTANDFGAGENSLFGNPRGREAQSDGEQPSVSGWKTVGSNEIHELYSTGLVRDEDALWNEPAFFPPIHPAVPAPASAGMNESNNGLRPPSEPDMAGSDPVRPGGAGGGGETEKRRALAPLLPLGREPVPATASPAAPEVKTLRPPAGDGRLARL